MLMKCEENDHLLKRTITSDKMWIVYNNVVPNGFGPELMICYQQLKNLNFIRWRLWCLYRETGRVWCFLSSNQGTELLLRMRTGNWTVWRKLSSRSIRSSSVVIEWYSITTTREHQNLWRPIISFRNLDGICCSTMHTCLILWRQKFHLPLKLLKWKNIKFRWGCKSAPYSVFPK